MDGLQGKHTKQMQMESYDGTRIPLESGAYFLQWGAYS